MSAQSEKQDSHEGVTEYTGETAFDASRHDLLLTEVDHVKTLCHCLPPYGFVNKNVVKVQIGP
jgi:hypothetical protein